MKQVIYLSVLLLLISGCKSSTKKETLNPTPGKPNTVAHQIRKPAVDSVEVDPLKIGCIATDYSYGYNENFSPGTFGKITYVYNSTRQAAKVIDTLAFNTSVNILKEYPNFFLVCTPKAKSGYIKKTDLYFHSVFWGLKSNTYLFGIGKYPSQKDNEAEDAITCDAGIIKVVKINSSKKVLNVFEDSIQGNRYALKLIYNSALKNSEAVFYLNYDCDNDIGVTTAHFIVDNGKKLSRLLISSSSGDGGDSEESTVYLPVTLDNSKKTVLAKNGVISVDNTTAKVEIYPYPVNCGIPIDELVVVEDKSVEDLNDETTGKPKYNNDGTMAQKITINATTYYQWDGNKLRKIKTVK